MLKLLLTDDHHIFIEGMTALFDGVADMEVVGVAVSASEAMSLLEKIKPDILLTDIQMPNKNGIELTTEVVSRFQNIKVVALSMLDEKSYVRKMREAGASGYLLKTMGADELLTALRKIHQGEKYFPELEFNQDLETIRKNEALDALDQLTKRELEILKLIAAGLTDKEIAERVFVSPFTVISHRKNLLSKLGLKNKVELARFAIENFLA